MSPSRRSSRRNNAQGKRVGESPYSFKSSTLKYASSFCSSLRMLSRSIRSRSSPRRLFAIYHYCLCTSSLTCLTLPHHCSESLPITQTETQRINGAQCSSMVRRPLLTAVIDITNGVRPLCVDFTSPVNMVFKMYDYAAHNITQFFFPECFRKTAGDCQSKHRFCARTTCQLFINREGGKLSFRHLMLPILIKSL